MKCCCNAQKSPPAFDDGDIKGLFTKTAKAIFNCTQILNFSGLKSPRESERERERKIERKREREKEKER